MRRSIVLCLLCALITALVPSPALGLAGTSQDYILGQMSGATAYGNYGQIWAYGDWPEYQDTQKHVSSIYMYQDEDSWLEIGFNNDAFTQQQSVEDGWSNHAAMFYACVARPARGWWERPITAAPEDAWVTFEMNNHQMYTGGPSAWYAAWNGHTVLHGQGIPGMYNAVAQASSERWGLADSRSSFRYLQYKRIQGNWAAWPKTSFADTDLLYAPFLLPGYTNRFYMYKV